MPSNGGPERNKSNHKNKNNIMLEGIRGHINIEDPNMLIMPSSLARSVPSIKTLVWAFGYGSSRVDTKRYALAQVVKA